MNNNNHHKILILGAGMAGLGAGITFKKHGLEPIILEKEDRVGGLFSNSQVDECDFDYGPKILLLDDSPDAKEILSFLGTNYEQYPVEESVYLKELGLLKFPLQRYLVELPVDMRKKSIESLRTAQEQSLEVHNFKDWLIKNYGKYFAELILIPYEEKKWQIDLSEMDYRWALKRPVKVNIDEVIEGSKKYLRPNKTYFYPKKGNISALTTAMAEQAGTIHCNHAVTEINLDEKYVIAQGKKFTFDTLISTLPLDLVVRMTTPMPSELLETSQEKLKRLSIKVINIVFDGNHDLEGTAIYFPEKDYIFRRVSVLQNLCPALSRKGKTPISVEVSINHSQEKSEKELFDQVLHELQTIPQFKKLGKPSNYEIQTVAFAYPLQIRGYSYHVADLHRHFDNYDVYHCGRGGMFDYCNGDIAYSQGKSIAQKILLKEELKSMKQKSLTFTVGIPSYNSGQSIVSTVKSLRESKNVGKFDIIVSVDGPTMSKDIEKQLTALDVTILKNKERGGQTVRNTQIGQHAKTDILVMTQDDVLFKPNTLSQILTAFVNNPDLTMVAPMVEPLKAENQFERMLQQGVQIVRNVAASWRNGDNYLSSVGRCLAYQTNMFNNFELDPKIINCDAYYYFENKRLGGYFEFVPSAVVNFRVPQNMNDHLKQVRKFVVSEQEMNNYLEMDFNQEYAIPRGLLLKSLLKEIVMHPYLTAGYLAISTYARTRPKAFYEEVTRFWEVDESTKNL